MNLGFLARGARLLAVGHVSEFDDAERQLLREVLHSDTYAPLRDKLASERAHRRTGLLAEARTVTAEFQAKGQKLATAAYSAQDAVKRAEHALEVARAAHMKATAEWSGISSGYDNRVGRIYTQLRAAACSELGEFRASVEERLERIRQNQTQALPVTNPYGQRDVPAEVVRAREQRGQLIALLLKTLRDVADWELLSDEDAISRISERELEIQSLSVLQRQA